jgi:hypothetical protein
MFHALLLAVALPTYGPVPQPSPSGNLAPGMRLPIAPGEALIVNSGSTNRAGYRLRVYDTGWTALQQGDVPLRKRVPLALVKRFFADLRAAGPLDELQTARCMKSMSFGSSTQIAYRGKISADISCGGTSEAVRALEADALALADAAGVSMLPRSVREL